MPDDRSAPPFELGLVMAGAVSAGAYTAGVVDFLLQALDAWEQARERGEDVPRHRVRIGVLAGASAGGMTAAMLAALVGGRHRPVTALPGRRPTDEELADNPLYRSWVRDIDIAPLLETRDLRRRDDPVRSLLDASVLDDIAERALRVAPAAAPRPYFDEPLHLYLTLTNLRGVPYHIHFAGPSGEGHGLSLHADHLHFVWSRTDPGGDALWLDPGNPDAPAWQQLRRAALATGAFPGGLAPRALRRPSTDYERRRWALPRAVGDTGDGGPCHSFDTIEPAWPEAYGPPGEPFDYDYLCVDGGVCDNEPLELARRRLAGEGRSNPRRPEEVHRSVLMIDPFPTARAMPPDAIDALADYDVVQTLLRMATALKHQARFKLDELKLAQNEHVYSRFLIAPRRSADGHAAEPALASAALGGFGGFLSELFRIHDFQLGRRNCQRFLQKHFALPLAAARANPVFGGGDYPQPLVFEREGAPHVPIVPVVGRAAEEVHPLRWPTLRLTPGDLAELRPLVDRRADAVLDRLAHTYVGGTWARGLVRLLARYKRPALVRAVLQVVERDLAKAGLFRERTAARG